MGKENYKNDQLEKLKKQKIDYKPQEIVLSNEIKEVNSEEEYWKYHTIYIKKLNKLSCSMKKAVMYPDEYLKNFETYLSEMLAYGLVDIEWVNIQRQKIYKNLNYPSTLRNWVIKKVSKVRDKLKKSK